MVVEGGKARAFTRRGYDWSHRYKRMVQAAASLPVKSAILDGETVVLGGAGLPDYQALERHWATRTRPSSCLLDLAPASPRRTAPCHPPTTDADHQHR
ncbi:hypothetical protein [Mesorhizobium sp. M7A.F.Ca.US.010.02.1.1]|uniref:hypothetical protein n=1 Tax=Mesorhizobium sp. M7A.F.Ca.US.010.02.1.1 TaxID=2496743 RepID=UPI001FE1AA97|nr:hypothetical protein [Mesorhizobium sp. M7A.F.Ca.US.010.02.1.1]